MDENQAPEFRFAGPVHAGPQKKRPSPYMIASGVLLLLAVVFFALFLRSWMAYRASDRNYQELGRQVVLQGREEARSSIDFDTLLAQNPDAVAWLEIPGIDLSLPVAHTGNNDYYLHHGFDGAANDNGCLFLAAQDSGDFSDLYNIVYGHNIHNGSMFGRLSDYADEAFYTANPTFTLYTPDGDYTCRIFSCHEAREGDEVYTYGWQQGDAYDELLTQLCMLSDYDTGVVPHEGDKVLTLSTCASSYAANTRRYVVHAILEPLT